MTHQAVDPSEPIWGKILCSRTLGRTVEAKDRPQMIDLLTSIPRVPEDPYFETIRTYGELGVLVKNKVNFENTKKLFIFTLTYFCGR